MEDKVDDFIDVNKFNEEVEKMSKEKVFDKPVKEYGIESYKKVLDKLFDSIPVPPQIKEGVTKGMLDMLKAAGLLEHITPESFEKLINSVILPHKRPNNPDFLAGMFGGNNPFNDVGIFGGGNRDAGTPNINSPPPQVSQMLGQIFGGGGPPTDVMKLSGKLRDSHISIEITDEFTYNMALDVLEEYGAKYDDEYIDGMSKDNADKSKS